MSNSTYLRAIAVLELIGVGVGVIFYIVRWMNGSLDAIEPTLRVIYLILLVIFGPAAGITLLTVVNTHDMTKEMYEDYAKEKMAVSNRAPSLNYQAGDAVVSSEPILGKDGKTIVPLLSVGKVTKRYTEKVEVEFKVDGKVVVADAQFKSINKK